MLCIGPPPNLAANCRLSVGARSRPQCRAGVHARRSSLASPHSAANRRLRRFTICPRRTFPPFPPHPLPPPPPPAANLQSLPCKGRCRRRRRRGAAPRPANTFPARRTRSPATYLRRGRCFASPRRQTSRQTAAYPSVPVPGHNVGRAFTPAAAALRHHTAPQTAACVDLQYAPAAPSPLSRHTRFRRLLPPPQTSKASPARGGAAAGGGGVPHLAPPIPFRVAAFPRHRTPCTDPRRFATCLPLPRRKTKTAARLFAGPRSPRVLFHCLRRRARMGRRVLPRYASPPSSRRINGTTSLGWMSSTSANSVYSIFSASRIAASSKPESRLPTACRFFLKS